MTEYDADFGSGQGALPSHLYVHVPFCASKCSYCDFPSVAGASEDTAELVFRATRTQLRRWERSGLDGVLETIYIGGGTPSLYAEKVASLLDYVRDNFPLHAAPEITVEANPDSVDEHVASALAGAGVTRVSVGVQSFDDHVLSFLGRRHDADAAQRACETVLQAGLDLSVDLMCGIPGQSRSSWTDTIARAVCAEAGHISVYPLSIEHGTELEVAIDAGLVKDPEPDDAAEAMCLALASLERHGFQRYEVASYAAAPEFISRHNTAYWTGRSYIGIGPAAHGMLDAASARAIALWEDIPDSIARVRYSNAPSIEDWLLGTGDEVEMLTETEADREDAMLGLRLASGIGEDLAARAGVTHTCLDLADEGLLVLADGRWRATERGWLLGNEVFGRIWNDE